MNNRFCFALPPSLIDLDVRTLTQAVKTRKWVKTHQAQLKKHADNFTSAGSDTRRIVASLLDCAFGVNIGAQVVLRLNDGDFEKIKKNVLVVVYS
jgi:hypothetical protein